MSWVLRGTFLKPGRSVGASLLVALALRPARNWRNAGGKGLNNSGSRPNRVDNAYIFGPWPSLNQARRRPLILKTDRRYPKHNCSIIKASAGRRPSGVVEAQAIAMKIAKRNIEFVSKESDTAEWRKTFVNSDEIHWR